MRIATDPSYFEALAFIAILLLISYAFIIISQFINFEFMGCLAKLMVAAKATSIIFNSLRINGFFAVILVDFVVIILCLFWVPQQVLIQPSTSLE